MKRITSYEIALSALACALATVFLSVGAYSEILLFTGYLVGSIALMMPLAKRSYRGYVLSYIATCLLTLLFTSYQFYNILPFVMFFGLHPLVNELQLKIKINRWLACALKALWFDGAMYLTWSVVFQIVTPYAWINEWSWLIILVFGTLFFVFYDYLTYRARAIVNTLVARIHKK